MECFVCLMLLVNRRSGEVRFWPKRGPSGVSGVLCLPRAVGQQTLE